MPSWLLKTAAHRAICWLPKRQFWNGLFQNTLTKSTVLSPTAFEVKLAECRHHLDALLSAKGGAPGFQALELGTGWYPAIALSLYLCGADKVWTIDIDPLLNAERLAILLEYFSDGDRRGDLKRFLPALLPERMARLRELLPGVRRTSPTAILAQLQIHVVVGDARQSGLSVGSVDFFVSNGVLEYIPRPVLYGILQEFRRVAAPGAVMSHRLNLVDVFAYFDKSITPFNYLQYTDRQWRWRNSPLIWQSRLRICDYRDLITEAGFRLVREESVSGSAEVLSMIPLAPEFRHYSQQDLLVLHSYLLAQL
jgi:hypothetical protein